MRYAVLALGLILIVSACSRKPNLIPYGYEKVFEEPYIASSIAKIDYPVLYPVDPKVQSINFRVQKQGERVWFWHGQFWSAVNWYQIAMIKHGDRDAICETVPQNPDIKSDVTTIQCNFPEKTTAKDYMNKPLAVLLHYYVGGQKETMPGKDDQPTGTVSRVYYLIPDE
jgi:hypothetical protein